MLIMVCITSAGSSFSGIRHDHYGENPGGKLCAYGEVKIFIFKKG
jgi:hypothetical protein